MTVPEGPCEWEYLSRGTPGVIGPLLVCGLPGKRRSLHGGIICDTHLEAWEDRQERRKAFERGEEIT